MWLLAGQAYSYWPVWLPSPLHMKPFHTVLCILYNVNIFDDAKVQIKICKLKSFCLCFSYFSVFLLFLTNPLNFKYKTSVQGYKFYTFKMDWQQEQDQDPEISVEDVSKLLWMLNQKLLLKVILNMLRTLRGRTIPFSQHLHRNFFSSNHFIFLTKLWNQTLC